jgi:hypothetical protein
MLPVGLGNAEPLSEFVGYVDVIEMLTYARAEVQPVMMWDRFEKGIASPFSERCLCHLW